MTMTTLKMALLDLLKTTGDPDLRPLIGGGYGIYLKYQQVLEANTRTLLTERPEARSTNDIDIFLRTELLVDGKRLEPLKEALEEIGYVAVEGTGILPIRQAWSRRRKGRIPKSRSACGSKGPPERNGPEG